MCLYAHMAAYAFPGSCKEMHMRQEGTIVIRNPVLSGMYPDPSWIWDGERDCAILVNSSFELVPGLPIHISMDMGGWTPLAYAVDEQMAHRLLLDYVEDSGGLYAPTLRRVGGRYVIACTVSRLDGERARSAGVDEELLRHIVAAQGNFVIESESPEGPWRGPFWVLGAEGIDPDLFEDDDGTVYWTQTREARHPEFAGQTEIWTQPIDPVSWSLVPRCDAAGPYGKTVIWRGYGDHGVWVEGPHLYRVGDYVYMITAEGGTSYDHSEMIMRVHAPDGFSAALQSDSVSDVKHGAAAEGNDERCVHGLFVPNPRNPFVTHRNLGLNAHVQCVGHGDLLRHPRLGWFMACLGTRQTDVGERYPLNFLGRETFVAPVVWQRDHLDFTAQETDSSPGWPVIAASCGRVDAEWQLDPSTGAVERCCWPPECPDDYKLMDLRIPFGIGVKSQSVLVRGDTSMVYRRLDAERCLMLLPGDARVCIRLDSRCRLDVDICGNELKWRAQRGDRLGPQSGDVVSQTGEFAVLWERGKVSICEFVDGKGILQLTEIDARFLSADYNGGFVGCLVGIGRRV